MKELIDEKDGFKVYLEQDEDAFNPRTDYENAGKMVCWHRRYDLGDKHDFESPGDFLDWWKKNGKGGEMLPCVLLDHSGLWMKTSRFNEDPGQWDSGVVGKTALPRHASQIMTAKISANSSPTLSRILKTPLIRANSRQWPEI